MRKLLTATQMKCCDKYTIEKLGIPSNVLMENAAKAAAEEIFRTGLDLSRVLVVCGNGNNGGDGLELAGILASAGVNVEVYFCGDKDRCTFECRERLYEVLKTDATFIDSPKYDSYTLIVDAILGIGLSRLMDKKYADTICKINDSVAVVVSLDIPSGISADTGDIMGVAVKADLTVTFAEMKLGHILYPGTEYCGEVVVKNIGIGTDVLIGETLIQTTEPDDLSLIPPRLRYSNKGTYGRVLIIAGSYGMSGAAYLSAKAAYRTGAGLVEIFTLDDNRVILQTQLPEAILTVYDSNNFKVLLDESITRASVVVIGPGLGASSSYDIVAETLIKCKKPLIIDADALNVIANNGLKFPKNTEIVVTPHPGEMARLIGKPVSDITNSSIQYAIEYSKRNGIICVLKDARTVISDGDRTVVNTSGCSAMAKAGSGDVLTGVIGALAAQGMTLADACVIGVYVHGLAGEAASKKHGEYSTLASETADSIADVLESIVR